MRPVALVVEEVEPRLTPGALSAYTWEPAVAAEFGPDYRVAAAYAPDGTYLEVVTPGPGGGPRVAAYADTGEQVFSVYAPGFDPAAYRGGLAVTATASAIVVWPIGGPNGAVVAVMTTGGEPVAAYDVFLDPGYRGPVAVDVRAGDLSGDGRPELVAVAPGNDRVVVLDLFTGAQVASWRPAAPAVGFAPAAGLGVGFDARTLGVTLDLEDGRTVTHRWYDGAPA